jgi:hypothetical protein
VVCVSSLPIFSVTDPNEMHGIQVIKGSAAARDSVGVILCSWSTEGRRRVHSFRLEGSPSALAPISVAISDSDFSLSIEVARPTSSSSQRERGHKASHSHTTRRKSRFRT